MVQFILKHDRGGRFRFASLQNPFAARILTRHGVNPDQLDTVYVVIDNDSANLLGVDIGEGRSGEVLLARSDAVLYVLDLMGGFWRLAGRLIRLLPRGLRDRGYRAVAARRYRIFGRYETCPIPSETTRARFLDQ
jgi:predicted DCC family thiol-disulfide oxidoreductase YuxK